MVGSKDVAWVSCLPCHGRLHLCVPFCNEDLLQPGTMLAPSGVSHGDNDDNDDVR